MIARASVTLALIATSATVVTLHHHRHVTDTGAATLAPVIPLAVRASRAHVREPLPLVKSRPHPGKGASRSRSSLRVARPASGSGTPWLKLAECESSGDWHANTGNSFYGGLQFTQQTWVAYGGLRYAQRADLASSLQQILVAERVLRDQGPQAWPVCSLRVGMR